MQILTGNITVTLDMQERRGWGIENYVFPPKTNDEIDPWFLERLTAALEEAKVLGAYNTRRMSVVYDQQGFLIRW